MIVTLPHRNFPSYLTFDSRHVGRTSAGAAAGAYTRPLFRPTYTLSVG